MIKVKEGQTIFDICLQNFGSIEPAAQLATNNGIVLSDDIAAGTMIDISGIDVVNTEVVDYYRRRQITVNSGAG